MSTNSGGILMACVLQLGMKVRILTGLALVAIFGVLLLGAAHANAESAVFNQWKTNVYFRYGVGPALACNGYTNVTEIYRRGKKPGFHIARSERFGGIRVHHKEVLAKYVRGESVIEAAAEYRLPSGKQIYISRWNGRSSLPLIKMIHSSKAKLIYAIVGVHSNKLPNQPRRPAG